MIGPDTFIKACCDHDVQVVTWTYRYDFRRNPYDMDQFRMQCQISARFIKDHVGYMHKMKERVMQRGQYYGGCVAIGYIVNDDGYLTPYEPHAEIVRWIFKRYRECGNVRQVGRELHAKGYAFPSFEPRVKIPHLRLKTQNRGYILAHGGIITILTNVVYIGYWKVRRQVFRDKDGHPTINHPPIVDENDFWYAFNCLSPTTIDGEINEQREATVRYVQEGKVPSQALLKFVIKSVDAPVYTAKASWKETTWEQYAIRNSANPQYSYATITHTAMFDATLLDAAFVERMFVHLTAWKEQKELKGDTKSLGEAIYQQLQEEESKEQPKNPTQAIDEQLQQLEPKIAHYDRLVDKGYGLPEEKLRQYGEKLAGLLKQQRDLEAARKAIQAKDEEKTESKKLLDETLEKWNTFSLEAKRRVIKLIVESVIISKVAPGWIKVEIVWKGIGLPTADIGYLRVPNSPNPDWLPEEIAILQEMYPYGDADEILEKLPRRAWRAIISKTSKLKINRYVHNPPTARLLLHLSLNDLKFIQEHDLDPHTIRGSHLIWSDCEVFLPVQPEDTIIESDWVSSGNEDTPLPI